VVFFEPALLSPFASGTAADAMAGAGAAGAAATGTGSVVVATVGSVPKAAMAAAGPAEVIAFGRTAV